MLKRYGAAIGAGLLALALMATVYLSFNQKDFDKRTLLPADYHSLSTDSLFFDRGSYTFTFHYAYAPGTEVRIVRALTAGADNALPEVLFSAPLSETGQTQVTLTFGRSVYDIVLRYTAETERGFTNVESVGPVWRDTALAMLLIAASAAFLGVLYLREKRRKPELGDTGYTEATVHTLLLFCAVFLTLPALRDFFVSGHDLAYHLMRIENIKDGLLGGQFPVRVGPTYLDGAGYASPMLYPEMFLYLPALFRLGGASIMGAYQAFVFLINLATLLVTYHAVKRLAGKASIGLIASVVYAMGVNRLTTLFTRAALGETLALIFFPCVLLGMAETLHRGKLSKWLIAGMTGLIQTHVISVEIAAALCAAYTVLAAVLRKTTLKSLLRLAAAAGITVLLNLWFLVPFFRFTLEPLRMFDYTTRTMLHAVYPAQLFATFVQPFGNAEYLGTTAEMPLSVGLLPAVGILLLLIANPKDDRTLRNVGRASLLLGLSALLVATTVFPWTYAAKIPLLGTLLYAVQFPWRFLGAAGFLLSVAFAVGAYGLGRDHSRALIAVCLAAAVFNAAPFLDQFLQSADREYVMRSKYDTASLVQYATWDYVYADTDPGTLGGPMAVQAPEGVAISGLQKSGTHLSFSYASVAGQTVTLPVYLYPGYRVTLNGADAVPLEGENHSMALALPAGEGTVSLQYEGFWYFSAADFVSLLTLLGIGGVLANKNRNRRKPAPAAP